MERAIKFIKYRYQLKEEKVPWVSIFLVARALGREYACDESWVTCTDDV